MYKKIVKYTDYNGVERKEELYFNLTKAELTDMELSKDGGMVAFIKKITSTMNGRELSKMFKDLILMSYGEKSDDGRRFIKSSAISEAFSQTEAYSQIYMELLTDYDAAQAFVNGIMPADIQAEAAKLRASGKLAELGIDDPAELTPLTQAPADQ